ncbi:butyrophilin-like protein 2 [Sciurus carolinensis]|uniref:butyrophilin-like protein 2 n=1 Tax=Sciurus carolinensis TaxID=30640 RepID=UPI001FB32E2E|nr:butyrophilin-like protein 2 [Sciurus carolinensis]
MGCPSSGAGMCEPKQGSMTWEDILPVHFLAPVIRQFHVIGPRSPVIAEVGEEAVFSCHLRPAMDAQHMEVTWYHNHQPGLVHDYRNGQDHVEQQRQEYRGRTQFLKGNISQGQVALRLRPIRPSDGGDYRCLFASPTEYREAQFSVIVTASGLAPRIHVEPGPSRSIKLTCMSRGWYPGPEVQWSGPGGLHLEPASETKTVEADGLFHVESSLTVGESSRGHVSCSIRNPVFNEEKEAHVSMAAGTHLWDLDQEMCLVQELIPHSSCYHLRRTPGDLRRSLALQPQPRDVEDTWTAGP